MGPRFRFVMTASLIVLSVPAVLGQAAPLTGISGRVIDASRSPVANGLVLVLDARSGVPLHEKEWRPLATADAERMSGGFLPLRFARLDEEGSFAFPDAPAGEYRLVAQSWPAATALAMHPLGNQGAELRLLGIAEGVKVVDGRATTVELFPAGTATLRLREPEGDLIVVSRKPPAADPILGFNGWSGPFLAAALAVHRKAHGLDETVIRGLPAGRVHLTVFANDNNPGFGAAEAELVADAETRVDIPALVATWSNGITTPPKSLEPLVATLEDLVAKDPGFTRTLLSQLGDDAAKSIRGNPKAAMTSLIPYLDREITLEGTTKARFGDVAAALAYLRIRRVQAPR